MMLQLTRRTIHVSWLVASACVGIVIGVTLVPSLPTGMFLSHVWLLSAVTLIVFGIVRGRGWVVPIVLIGGVCTGLWRGSIVAGGESAVTQSIGKTITLHAVVNEDTDISTGGQTVLRLRRLYINGHAVEGRAWATVRRTDKIRRSDEVTIIGKASDGFGNFSISLYRANVMQIKRPVPGDVALQVRDWFARGVERAIGQPEASLGLGYLLGQRRGLPEKLDTALKAAGLTHVVVASGYNLTILVRFARRLFERVSKYLSLVSASAMIIGFMAITGLSPSMSRAGLVAGLSLFAWYYGRRFHPLVLLPLSMAVTVLLQPSYAWGDLGWQLSFAAFAGVMITAPLIHSYFFGDMREHVLRRIFIETISAQILTLPILLLGFGTLSIVAPLANILILPLVPLAMVLTFLAGIAGLSLPFIAGLIGFPAEVLLKYMTTTAQYMGNLPWATQNINITPAIAAILYVGIGGFTTYLWVRTRLPLEQTSLVE